MVVANCAAATAAGAGPAAIIIQPGSREGQDIWVDAVYSFVPHANGPGGGRNASFIALGGWGAPSVALLRIPLRGQPTRVHRALLQLYLCATRSTAKSGTVPLYLERIEAAWDWKIQGTGPDRRRLWWPDLPATTRVSGELPAPRGPGFYSIDITALYHAWRSGAAPNHGVLLRPADYAHNRHNRFLSADSPEAPLRPRLVLLPTSDTPLPATAERSPWPCPP